MIEEIQKYIEAIKYVKRYKKIDNIPSDMLKESELIPLEKIIETMDKLNEIIAKHSGTEKQPIKSYLDYMKNVKCVKYSEKKYEHLFFSCHNISDLYKNTENGIVKTEKTLDFSYKDKLFGFVVGSGEFKWENNEIDQLIKTIKAQHL